MKAIRQVPPILALGLLLAGIPALAQTLRLIPVPPGVKPQWQAVQGAPQVSFAPNLPTDVFRYRGNYYLYWNGLWFTSRNLQGPWNHSRRLPPALGRIPSSYFKTALGPSRPGAEPSTPAGAGTRDHFSVPGVAPPPGWTPPPGSGQPPPVPPAEGTPPKASPPFPEGSDTRVPKAM